jgi:hypothetical protein
MIQIMAFLTIPLYWGVLAHAFQNAQHYKRNKNIEKIVIIDCIPPL